MRHIGMGQNPSTDPQLSEWLSRLVTSINNVFTTVFTPTWDDLKFPATAVNPPGLVSDPTWDINIPGWLFAPTSTEMLHLVGQLPHSWLEESELRPHVHWTKTSSAVGDVYWQLEYAWAGIGDVITSFTTLSSSTTVGGTPDNDTTNEHLITAFGSVPATGMQISDMLIMKLSRIGGHGNDTYGADARLLEFDIHHQLNVQSSFNEYT